MVLGAPKLLAERGDLLTKLLVVLRETPVVLDRGFEFLACWRRAS
jgi:hypothetical protein